MQRQQTVSPAISRLLAEGLGHHQAGRVAQAEALYRKILTMDARHADSLHLLGMIAFQAGQHESAVERIRKAIAIRGNEASYHSNLGAVFQGQQMLEEAIGCYERALELRPDYVEACFNLGLALQLQGKHEAAEGYHERVLSLRPEHAAAHYNLGTIAQARGRLEEAIGRYERAIAIKPDFADAYASLAAVLQAQGKLEEAIAQYERAIAIKPNYVGAINNLGTIFQAQRKLEEAAGCYARAIALKPDYAEAHNNLGNVLRTEGKYDAAVAQYVRALEWKPDSAEIYGNLGTALHALGRLNEAEGCHRRALELKPDYAEAYNNLGALLELRGDFAGAAAHYKRASELAPEYAGAAWNKALLQLLSGDLGAGLPGYERRWGVTVPQHEFAQRQWTGEPLHGARILLHAEQGLGDTLQQLRYVSMVQAAGGSVVLAVQRAVRRLAAELPGVAGVVTSGDAAPVVDWQCPLLSLPLAFGTTLDTIPAQVPYLSVPEEALRKAATLAWPAAGLRVGIVWAGNATHTKDRYRSIPLRLLEGLFGMEGVHFFSLQMGPEAAQLAAMESSVTDLTQAIGDMADTAALMMHLDLVVAVDTSVAHLAGALGKKVWVMLPVAPDWRWMLGRSDSPWYPSMRLFRQTRFEDWQTVLDEVRSALVEERIEQDRQRVGGAG
jgi:tetratricopeptide (TPR) repeat protein